MISSIAFLDSELSPVTDDCADYVFYRGHCPAHRRFRQLLAQLDAESEGVGQGQPFHGPPAFA